jgi:hypothetical protein
VRVHRYRDRRRGGLRLIKVEIPEANIEDTLACGLLEPREPCCDMLQRRPVLKRVNGWRARRSPNDTTFRPKSRTRSTGRAMQSGAAYDMNGPEAFDLLIDI